MALQASQCNLRVAQAALHYSRCSVRPSALESDSEITMEDPWEAMEPRASGAELNLCGCHHHRLQQREVWLFVLQDQSKLLHQSV